MVPKIVLVTMLVTLALPWAAQAPEMDDVHRFVGAVGSRIGFQPTRCPTDSAARVARRINPGDTTRVVCGRAALPQALDRVAHEVAFDLAADGVPVLDLGSVRLLSYQLADQPDLRPVPPLAGYRFWVYLIDGHRIEVWLGHDTIDDGRRPVIFRTRPLLAAFPLDFLAIERKPAK